MSTDEELIREHLGTIQHRSGELFALLNQAMISDGLFLHLEAGVSLDKPIEVIYLSDSTQGSIMAQPRGLVVLEEGALPSTSAAARRLLRPARYFDGGGGGGGGDGDATSIDPSSIEALLDAAEGGARCFRGGGTGHMQRDCTAPPPPKPCFLGGRPGHDRAACPSALCFRCGAPGHTVRVGGGFVKPGRRQGDQISALAAG